MKSQHKFPPPACPASAGAKRRVDFFACTPADNSVLHIGTVRRYKTIRARMPSWFLPFDYLSSSAISFLFARASLALFFIQDIHSADLEWQPFGSHRAAPLPSPTGAKAGFVPASPAIQFTNRLSAERSLTNQVFLNGSGVAAADVDGDGLCDLYFCGLDNPNELYRNLGGWRFERITESAGVACADQASTGAAFADLDGDGDMDLLVNGIARGTRLFLNDGRARFREAAAEAGLSSSTGSMSLAMADVNGDGYLDLYVVNYRSSTFRDEPEKRFRVVTRGGKYELSLVDGRPVTEPDLLGRFSVDPVFGVMEHGQPDVLFLNEGGKRFRPVSWSDGTFLDESGSPMPTPYDWGLSAMFRDLNNDGAPDLYVCNDFQSPDRIWINNGTGKFRLIPDSAFRETSLFSMGVDCADLDGDGLEEIFVADMLSRRHDRRQTQVMDRKAGVVPNTKFESRPQFSRNTLFWNRGNGTYAEIAQLAGLEASEWSWCPVFLDVDLDGRRDLLVTAGHERDAQHIDVAREIDQAKNIQKIPWRQQIEMRRKFPRLDSPILAFQNQGGLRFTEVGSQWGFNTAQITHGLALADLDNDGDLDLAVSALNSPALLYRNDTPAPRLAIQLRGIPPNTHGIGAKISIEAPGLPLQSDEMVAAGRYLSSDAPRKTFAAKAGAAHRARVRWRSGLETVLTNAQANTLYEISEHDARQPILRASNQPAVLFIEVPIQHSHHDEPFDDFQRQPLLPRKFSELGPAVAWHDLDADGWEELLIGSGRGGKLACFKNERGKLQLKSIASLASATARDHAGILGLTSGTNSSLLIGFSNYEDGLTNPAVVKLFSASTTNLTDLLPGSRSSVGPLALADADGDGDLDLFAAGRIVPSRYPEAATSVFLRNDSGKFIADETLNRAFDSFGLVSAAIWSDLDGDGPPELLLAIDGGPLRVFTLRKNAFHELTADLGLDRWTGWWQSISTGDFNHDGRMDIVAGNLGRNSKYQKLMPDRYHLYYGELTDDGTFHVIEAYQDETLNKIVPMLDRDSLALNLPDLKQRSPTFTAFGMASVSDFLGARTNRAQHLSINTTETMLFLNSGKTFTARPLPLQAQVSPVFGIAVGDLNADGEEDLVLTQNLFSTGKDTSRYDAGQGSVLLGQGDGTFDPLPAGASGLNLEGEGRGAALCDFDHDGRLDLAAAQNSGPTKIYRNASSTAGIRIAAHAGSDNPHGIGASIRLRYENGQLGPAHEIRAGEGYWSQASPVVILGMRGKVRALEVRWPDGSRQTVPLEERRREILVRKN